MEMFTNQLGNIELLSVNPLRLPASMLILFLSDESEMKVLNSLNPELVSEQNEARLYRFGAGKIEEGIVILSSSPEDYSPDIFLMYFQRALENGSVVSWSMNRDVSNEIQGRALCSVILSEINKLTFAAKVQVLVDQVHIAHYAQIFEESGLKLFKASTFLKGSRVSLGQSILCASCQGSIKFNIRVTECCQKPMCKKCSSRPCSLCGGSGTRQKNSLLSTIVGDFPQSCRCGFKYSLKCRNTHRKICPYYPFVCKFCNLPHQKMSLEEMLDHIQDEHQDQLFNEFDKICNAKVPRDIQFQCHLCQKVAKSTICHVCRTKIHIKF